MNKILNWLGRMALSVLCGLLAVTIAKQFTSDEFTIGLVAGSVSSTAYFILIMIEYINKND